MSKVCIVVPTYEEAENLPRLVKVLEEGLFKWTNHVIRMFFKCSLSQACSRLSSSLKRETCSTG